MNLTDYIKDVPNFPKKGIIFKDICPLLKSPEAWTKVMTQLGLFCEETTPDLIVGIESRGFIVGSEDELEIQIDAFEGNPRVLLIDDLLATGGTVNASTELIEKAGGQLVGCGFIIELNELNGRENVPNVPIRSLIRYD
jgi:adenine phosphoribosyltransferase